MEENFFTFIKQQPLQPILGAVRGFAETGKFREIRESEGEPTQPLILEQLDLPLDYCEEDSSLKLDMRQMDIKPMTPIPCLTLTSAIKPLDVQTGPPLKPQTR